LPQISDEGGEDIAYALLVLSRAAGAPRWADCAIMRIPKGRVLPRDGLPPNWGCLAAYGDPDPAADPDVQPVRRGRCLLQMAPTGTDGVTTFGSARRDRLLC